jgi:hypothetical protein
MYYTSMEYTIEDFKEEIEGKDVYLIGGGRSFNPEEHVPLLPKSRVICLNSALNDFDECLAVMWMDSSWQGNNTGLIREKRHKYAFRVNINVQCLETRNRGYIDIRNVSCAGCDYRVKREPYNVCGNNMGCAAIDLLDQLGAKTIYLLGFDCSEEDGKSHYHDRYKDHVKQDTYNKSFIPCFEKLSKHIKNSRVVNLSKESKIPCFKRANIHSILGKSVNVDNDK